MKVFRGDRVAVHGTVIGGNCMSNSKRNVCVRLDADEPEGYIWLDGDKLKKIRPKRKLAAIYETTMAMQSSSCGFGIYDQSLNKFAGKLVRVTVEEIK